MIKLEDMKELEYLGEMHNDVDIYRDKDYIYFLRLCWTGREYEILGKIKREEVKK